MNDQIDDPLNDPPDPLEEACPRGENGEKHNLMFQEHDSYGTRMLCSKCGGTFYLD